MSQTDNFDDLSNKDLREKCLEAGLPNVPVTDTSRKLLIKKLRLSIGSPAPSSPSTQQKKTNRRETIAVPKIYPNIDPEPNAAPLNASRTTKRAGSDTSRRTIAVAPSVGVKERAPAPATAANPVQAPAPISTRRRSMHTEPVPKPKLAASNLVIIESDDEDDEYLIEAAKQIQQSNNRAPNLSVHSSRAVTTKLFETVNQTQQQSTTIPTRATDLPVRPPRAGSLSKSSVTTTSFNQAVPPPLQEELYDLPPRNDLGPRNLHSEQQRAAAYVQPTRETFQYQQQQPLQKSYQYQTTTAHNTVLEGTRYSTSEAASRNYYSPPLRRTAAATTSSLRASNPINTYAEYSDDTDGAYDDGQPKSPFLSSFARNLERSRTEPVKRAIGKRTIDDIVERRTRLPQVYQPVGRNPAQEESLLASLWELMELLEQRYHLKRNFTLLFIILFILYFFIYFWQ